MTDKSSQLAAIMAKLIARIRVEKIGAPALWGHTIGDTAWLRSFHRSSVLSFVGMAAGSSTEDYGTAASWLEMLSTPKSFAGDEFHQMQSWMLFWSLVHSEHDLLRTFSRAELYEEPHSSAFFAHLASISWLYGALMDDGDLSGNAGELFWADCTKNDMETAVGSDFLIAVATGEDEVKVANFQAKRSKDGFADVSFKSKGKDKTQLQILLDLDIAAKQFVPSKEIEKPEGQSNPFGSFCYYVFWHLRENGIIPSPTVLSAQQVVAQGKPTTINAVKDCLGFSQAVGLFLADPGCPFGIKITRKKLVDALKKFQIKPSHIVGLAPGGSGWHLSYWWDLVDAVGGNPSIIAQRGTSSFTRTDAEFDLTQKQEEKQEKVSSLNIYGKKT